MTVNNNNNREFEKQKKDWDLLSDRVRSVLLGLVLGDGSLKIHSGYKNARMSFRHSITQKDYFFWKREVLRQELSGNEDWWEQTPDKAHYKEFGKHKLRYQSRARPCLTYLYNLTHETSRGSEIVIKRSWLNLMTPLSLAVWWFDDGSLVGNASQGVFCTDGFKKEDTKILEQYIKIVWNINVESRSVGLVKYDGQERFRLYIKTHEDLIKFLKLIIPHTPTLLMVKKVLLLYEDVELQQRWISEIVSNTSFTQQAVEGVCKERKSLLKKFKLENDIVHFDKDN